MKTRMFFFVSIILIIFSGSANAQTSKKNWRWEKRDGQYVKVLKDKPEPVQFFCYNKPFKQVCLTPSDTIGYQPTKKSSEPKQYNSYYIAEGGVTLPFGFSGRISGGTINDLGGIFGAVDFNFSLGMNERKSSSTELFLATGAKKFQYICLYGKLSISPEKHLRFERIGFGTSIHFSQIVSPKIITRGYVYLLGGESLFRGNTYYNMGEYGYVAGAFFTGIVCYAAKDFSWGTIEGTCAGGLDLPKGQKTSIYYELNTRIMGNILKGKSRWHGQIGIGFDANETDKGHFVLVMRIAG